MKTKSIIVFFLLYIGLLTGACADELLVEAESFTDKGGWVVDQQFMDQMGSPYLLAHGLGQPVEDAATTVIFPRTGNYEVYVRTFNWTSPWTDKPGPGKFQVSVNGQKLPLILGDQGKEWFWQKAGQVSITDKESNIVIHDLTGFEGRIDALYFTSKKGKMPPLDVKPLNAFRKKKLHIQSEKAGKYDLVVVGGGIAGMCAAATAARQGLKVALINNRPVLGGNNSAEVRVHLGAHVNIGKYPALGNLLREFGHSRRGNAKPAEYYEDDKKQSFIENEKNVDLYANYHVFAVNMKDKQQIRSVVAKHIESGKELVFEAPLFADCTGDGTVGVLAGADFAMGCESFDTYREPRAPKEYEKRTMGASVQWYSKEDTVPTTFPEFEYRLKFTEESCEKIEMGEWTWETGMYNDMITEFERIRDYGMLVVYSNWSFLKNYLKDNDRFTNRSLSWMAYIAGKRESRRLLGDLVLTENDLNNWVEYPDGTAAASWTVDLHYPDPDNSKHFPGMEFKSVAKHQKIYPYPIPYRCLYSRNISNLFMAGRHISVSHIALGTTRLMRTTAMLGEVVGFAAFVCTKHQALPRAVYSDYFLELDALMKIGAGDPNAPDNQRFNVLEMLDKKPTAK